MLTHDYDPTHGQKFCSIRKPKDVAREEECQAMAIELSKQVVTLHKNKEFNIHRLSMVGMFCVMHSMAIMVKDSSYDYVHKAAIALRPAIKRYALRWPFAGKHRRRFLDWNYSNGYSVDYDEHITDYIQRENDLMARHRDPNYYKQFEPIGRLSKLGSATYQSCKVFQQRSRLVRNYIYRYTSLR
jgi:hypothetical protein